MTGVRHETVAETDDGMRLDRWLRHQCPGVNQGQVQKWLRTGQVRVDGSRADAARRVVMGEEVRIPPYDASAAPARKADQDASWLREHVLHQDKFIIGLNKPAGLAVQGGSGTARHVDGMLAALQGKAPEPPRLVHRIDKDTAGVLLLARDRAVARGLTAAFKGRTVRKIYLAVVAGVPSAHQGEIRAALRKAVPPSAEQAPGARGRRERMVIDEISGDSARTLFEVVDHVHRRAALIALAPLSGRTHQLRVHCADALGTPILGDGKYGGEKAFLTGLELGNQMHLLARGVSLPHPDHGCDMHLTAPIPHHMHATLKELGLGVGLKLPGRFDDVFGDAAEL